ncbi:MAG: glycosyltransferase family 2 protein [Arcobacteraceae bacterium]|jgi:GT2 family glycosyltransferase|nr:glycosyltransferase family 2 protein [Arcobacteraceae bacterium]
MKKNIDISFITINYNSSHYTIELIKSIQKFTTIGYEIIIVDNASKEEDFKILEAFIVEFSNIKLIRNRINGGFASGNMLGVNYAGGEYYFFINNDTKLLNDCGMIMKNYLDAHQNIALATAKVNDEQGKFSSSYKLFPSLSKELFGNSIARKFSKNNFPSNKIQLDVPALVEVVSGSCMFFKASDFCEIGGFDTAFFLYCEEEDISKRVWNSGKEVVFLPEAEIYHASGGSTQKSFEIEREYYISYKHLIFKHFNFLSAFVLLFLQLFKLLRRSFKRKNGWKLFLFGLFGFKNKNSLRYKQSILKDRDSFAI